MDVLEKANKEYHCPNSNGWDLTPAICNGFNARRWSIHALKKHPRGLVLIANHSGKKFASVGINHIAGDRPWWLSNGEDMRRDCVEAALCLPDVYVSFSMEDPDFSLDEIHRFQELVRGEQ